MIFLSSEEAGNVVSVDAGSNFDKKLSMITVTATKAPMNTIIRYLPTETPTDLRGLYCLGRKTSSNVCGGSSSGAGGAAWDADSLG